MAYTGRGQPPPNEPAHPLPGDPPSLAAPRQRAVPEPGDLEPGPSTKRFGTGLGIPVAYKICRSHGWDLGFAGAPGGGTEVTISAPLAAAGGTG